MDTRDRHRLQRHARRIEQLRLWRNARERPIGNWRFAAGDAEPKDVSLGDFWPEVALPVRLSAEVDVPNEWIGLPVELDLWLAGEGFVRLSNGVTGGLNPFHRSYPVADEVRGGETLRIEAEVVSKGLFGSDVAEPRLTHAALVVPEPHARALERNLAVISEACEQLGWRGSSVDQTYKLNAWSRRLDIQTTIEWHEREVLLRALFPLGVRSQTATFETMYGAHERPTHRNTSSDTARFEVSAHRFCILSEPDYGVALLNDGKYGHSAKGNVLGLSLLRSPMYPDPLADEGHHDFTYALYPHPGDWTQAGVVEEAFALNSPLVALRAETGGGMLPAEWGSVRAEGVTLALGSLKRAEEGRGAILRLYEPHGARGRSSLRFALPVLRAERTNLMEETEGPVDVEGDALRFDVRPFEVVTLRVEFD